MLALKWWDWPDATVVANMHQLYTNPDDWGPVVGFHDVNESAG